MKVYFTSLASTSFNNEVDFIYKKWNSKEVVKFLDLVETFKKNISNNPYLGKQSTKKEIRLFVLSKQTIVFYKVIKQKDRIDLLYFWNTSLNPKKLEKIIGKGNF